ncbi:MAG: ABC transporter permease [Bacteroidales bacterium]|nr:ABC transporter permease [Bacteroidales bacterium]
MLKNYILAALRNMMRNKLVTFLNIIGLTVGLVCVILFFIWVMDEVSYDRFHENKNRIFNILTSYVQGETTGTMSVTPFPLAPLLEERYPEVESFTRFWNYPAIVKYGEITDMEQDIFLVDTGFFSMFSFPLKYGEKDEDFLTKSSIIITESRAKKYFGENSPVGKIIKVGDDLELTVTGIIEDPPENTIFDFSMLASIEHADPFRLYDDWSFAGPSYIMLSEGSSWNNLQSKIDTIYREFDPDAEARLVLQPLKDIYLYSDGRPDKIRQVFLFSGIAIIILLLACINYMNISTARSLSRSKEIGLRKTTGSNRKQIIIQFMSESFVITFISFFLALMLVELVQPVFNELTQKQLEINYGDPLFLFGLLALYIITSIISGIYPSLFLSSYKPVRTVEGITKSGGSKIFLNSLVILQFTVSVGLIICSVTVSRQVNYLNRKDIGINTKNIIVMPFGGNIVNHYDVLRDEFIKHPGIDNITASYNLPMKLDSYVSYTWDDTPAEDAIGVWYNMVDYDFIETMEIEMLQGRSFSRDHASDDSTAYIINKSAMDRMGVENAVGISINFLHPHLPEPLREGTIIGVVSDFNFRPLMEEISPLVLKIYRPFYNRLYVKYREDYDPSEVLKVLEEKQAELFPGLPFNYSFLDDEVQNLYRVEYRTGRIIRYFTLISIIISCMGIVGMALYDLELRTREVVIRKVLGSYERQIFKMLIANYNKWILLSFIIAAPLSYIITNRWLQNFAYSVKISPLTYVLSLLAVVVLTSLIVVLIGVKTIRQNPAEVLHVE